MNKNPILIVDDDNDDLEMLQEAFAELKIENEILIFNNGFTFLEYVRETATKTFFILCDINMALINGLELKRLIFEDERLRLKCLPFIFLSTSSASQSVLKAYSYGVQGYFVKPHSFADMKKLLLALVNYWGESQHPNL